MYLFITLAEIYAKKMCSLLSDPDGVFSKCHDEVDPQDYYTVSHASFHLPQ